MEKVGILTRHSLKRYHGWDSNPLGKISLSHMVWLRMDSYNQDWETKLVPGNFNALALGPLPVSAALIFFLCLK